MASPPLANSSSFNSEPGLYQELSQPRTVENNYCEPGVPHEAKKDEAVVVKESKSRSARIACILASLVVLVMLAIISCIVILFINSKSKSDLEQVTVPHPSNNLDEEIASQLFLEERFQKSEAALNDTRVTLLRQLANVMSQLTQLANDQHLLPFATVASCAALPPSTPSGYYWVLGSPVRVYCDMTRTCGNDTGGWMRVGYLDMNSRSHQCPSDLVERVSSGIRTCVRSSYAGGCSSVFFLTTSTYYSRVCGRIRGYQISSTNAFRQHHESDPSINDNYVDGVSLTHDNPTRQHIWTFAAALDRTGRGDAGSYCPCQTPNRSPPSFMANDYFCDSGNQEFTSGEEDDFQTDPLWDGTGCSCCNDSPWFHKQLAQPTTGDIEMRMCRNEDRNNEDVAIQTVEIYIQ